MIEPAADRRKLRCLGEPLSWLRLEQHRLGELSAADAAVVEAHLASCPACAACAAEAREPLAFSLPTVVGEKGAFTGISRARPRTWLRSWRAGISVGAVSAAAVVALAFAWVTGSPPAPGPRSGPVALGSRETLPGSKGGEVAIELVRERRGDVEHGAHAFLAEDRWKVLVTCPAERVLFWDVVVEDGGQASYPLSPAAPLVCGNHVALPGAFRLSGLAAKRLCVVLSGDPVDRRRFASGGPIDLDPEAGAGRPICVALRPEGSSVDGASDSRRR